MSEPSFQYRLADLLDPERHVGLGLSWLNRVILWMIVLTFIIGIVETEPTVRLGNEHLFHYGRILFLIVFAVEYAARLWVAPLNAQPRSAWQYALTPASLVDLVVLLGMILPIVGMEPAMLRMVRALRIVRLARFGRYAIALRLVYKAVSSRSHELAISLIAALGLLVISSAMLYFAEAEAQPETFGSIPRAMWWSIATLTTVGYGDAVPITALGRFFASVTAITGVAAIAVPTGIFAASFSDAYSDLRKGDDG